MPLEDTPSAFHFYYILFFSGRSTLNVMTMTKILLHLMNRRKVKDDLGTIRPRRQVVSKPRHGSLKAFGLCHLAFRYRFDGVVGYRICLTHRRSSVRAWVESLFEFHLSGKPNRVFILPLVILDIRRQWSSGFLFECSVGPYRRSCAIGEWRPVASEWSSQLKLSALPQRAVQCTRVGRVETDYDKVFSWS
jgi:hypothetical protein